EVVVEDHFKVNVVVSPGKISAPRDARFRLPETARSADDEKASQEPPNSMHVILQKINRQTGFSRHKDNPGFGPMWEAKLQPCGDSRPRLSSERSSDLAMRGQPSSACPERSRRACPELAEGAVLGAKLRRLCTMHTQHFHCFISPPHSTTMFRNA